MANLTVRIYSHEKRADGVWAFTPVAVDFDTRSTKVTPGKFKISWYEKGKKFFSKGHFLYLADAIKAAKLQELKLAGAANGLGWNATEPKADRPIIADAADAYLELLELKKKRPGTIALATHDLREYQKWNDAHAKRSFVDQISNEDLLRYRNWVVTSEREAQTAVNKVMRINHFVTQTLKLQPGKGPVTQAEAENIIVKKSANSVEYYSQAELDKFFAHCDARQHLLFSTFLWSGVRREELEYLYWDDLNFAERTLHVGPKAEFDFTTKTKEERDVVLPMELVARLKKFKETSSSRLVFPTSQGNPMGNSLLISCKRIARRAGLNCDVCKTCVKSGQCSHWYLHKFRATFATRCLQDGMTVADVQEQLGHNDLESTTHYLGNLKKPDMRARVDAMYARTATLAAVVPVTEAVQ